MWYAHNYTTGSEKTLVPIKTSTSEVYYLFRVKMMYLVILSRNEA